MPHLPRLPAILLCVGAIVTAALADAPLRGPPAWQALVGNTIAGSTPDGPYADYYTADGTVIHSDRDGTDRGHWVLRGETVCVSFPGDDADDCRTPEVEGDHGAFVDQDGSRYAFDILKGNARRL